jgi:tryptophan 2,3-dioxygenase
VTAYGKDARVSYSAYLKVPELLELQQPLADPPAHDELQFIVVHQVYELWFKLVLHELDAVKAALDAAAETDDDTPLRTASRLLKRIESIFKVLVQQIHVLESMRPSDFLDFRAQLNPASGFQSAQFREVECLMGLKDAALIRRVQDDPRIAVLQARFDGDTIPDALYRLLRARGLSVTPPDEHRSEAQAAATLLALRGVYEQPDEHPALYDLCEALVDVDEQLVLWRRHHIMMVERQIGAKSGTGKGVTGDLDGIRYLLTTLARQAVPDLWAVRTVLEA